MKDRAIKSGLFVSFFMKFIIGQKIEMTQRFLENGAVVPVTKIQAGPCFVAAKKDYGTENGRAIQLAYLETPALKLNSSLKGFFKKVFNQEVGYEKLKEFRLNSNDAMFDKLAVGQKFDVAIFNIGDKVDVQGVSRGLGFQGVVKRHHFRGGKKSHGHKDQLRMPGSIGAKGPAHVFKGSRMGGHMGDEITTVRNLEVVAVDPLNNELFLKGAVPGARKSILYIKSSGDFEIKNETVEAVTEPLVPVVEEVKAPVEETTVAAV